MSDHVVVKEVGPGAYALVKEPRDPGYPPEWDEISPALPGEEEYGDDEETGVFRVDIINNPPHYTSSGIETLDVIEAWGLNYRLGNVVKYISRAGKKDPTKLLEDLKKAEFYLAREIMKLEEK